MATITMTQEEKAKAYDEALEKAKEFKNNPFAGYDGTDLISALFPELKESEDEKMRKELIRAFKSLNTIDVWNGIKRSDIIAWLEKQGEQKPDKVEPKFKVGDWIINSIETVQITGYDIDYGYQVDYKGNLHHRDTDIIEEEYHLWTIQDAKDGDVLVNWNNTAFIFKTIEDKTVKFYIAYNEKWDTIETPSTKLSHLGLPEPQFEFHPATKEQRDTLMEAMADAGYTFDFEKKELKKIEQKHAEWNEEDEGNFKHLMDEIVCLGNNRNSANRLYYDRLIKFIKELKNRAQPKEKWCDKDERMLDRLIAYFEKQVAFTDDDNPRYANWLKSLKDRIQPQSKQEWSEQDETALGDALWCCKQAASIAKDENDMGNVWYAEHWLKSLRPQNH